MNAYAIAALLDVDGEQKLLLLVENHWPYALLVAPTTAEARVAHHHI